MTRNMQRAKLCMWGSGWAWLLNRGLADACFFHFVLILMRYLLPAVGKNVLLYYTIDIDSINHRI